MSEKVQRVTASISSNGFEISPTKNGSKSLSKTGYSSGQKPASLALTIIPSVNTNSDFVNRLNNGTLSASQAGLPSTRNARDNHNNIYHEKAKTMVFKSPTSKHTKTISLLSPSKSTTSVLGTTFATHKQQPSETVIRRLEDLKQTRDEKKSLGTEVYENVNYRKEIEKQVLMLETRVKRLQLEEKEMVKKINDTSEKTEKIIAMKKIHYESLVDKAKRNKNKEDNTSKRRQEILQEREDQKQNIQSSVLDSLSKRQNIAATVKKDNEDLKNQKTETQENTLQKNKETIKKIQETHNEFINKRQSLESTKRESVNATYIEKLESEKKKTEDLQEKFKELEQLEQQLLQKLSTTYTTHQKKINKLEKAFNLKVTADQPVEFDPNAETEEGEENGEAEEEEEGEAEEEEEEEAGEDDE